MKIRYIEKGKENNFKRIDRENEFYAIDYFNPQNTSLLYFRINQFEMKVIAKEDIIAIED